MDFQFSAEDEAYRDEVRAFLDDVLPLWWGNPEEDVAPDEPPRESRQDFSRRFQKLLAERGWLVQAWPKEHGGAGLGYLRQAMFGEVMSYRRAPFSNQGVDRVGPTIMIHGNDQQKSFFLDKIRNAEIGWCQGFSEPTSGSDLASLQTRAVRDGDDYVINGQKIWTSGAHLADWMFCLARTDQDAPKHKGISYFLIDMKTPGITIRPLVNMLGYHHFNEVFFEDVRLPARNLVGEENRGWYVATTTLDFERSGIGRIVGAIRTFEELLELATQPGPDGRRPIDNDWVRNRLAELQIEFSVGKLLSYRVAWMQSAGLIPNYEASISKVFGGEVQQRLSQMINITGLSGQLRSGSDWAALRGRIADEYMGGVPLTIAAGTAEIQRNIIATRGLGLPRD